jgi:uncharacterized repeat protein (TIGR01451 family)
MEEKRMKIERSTEANFLVRHAMLQIEIGINKLFKGRNMKEIMRNMLVIALFGLVVLLPTQATWAVGTPTGTDITNQATASYNVGPTNFVENSNVTTTTVAELLDVSTVWEDAAPVTVNPGDTVQITTFLVTNIGNGNDVYTLAGLSTLAGDDFNPTLNDLFFDTNGNGFYDPGVDAQYLPGVNDPSLDADQSIIVFVSNNIPTGVIDGDLGFTQLTATSSLGANAPGTIFPAQGDFGTDAVIGNTGGDDSDIGIYVVSNVVMTVDKSVIITDPFGTNEPIPGAVLSYSIVVTTAGSGIAENVVITDVIPANTTYNPGTLTLNSTPLTDIVDGDPGDVGGTTPNTVTVNLGDLAAPAPIQTITFDVTIN